MDPSSALARGQLRYSILDPTGNITALVESSVEVGEQPAVAAVLMARHPKVEQVGFVRTLAIGDEAQIAMRMAGGEFCGNATMSAAALWAARSGGAADGDPIDVLVAASGAERPVRVRLVPADGGAFEGCVLMPLAQSIERVELSFGELAGTLPVVRMEGISHVVVEPSSCFFRLLRDRPAAELAVRQWCVELGADGLGLMFLEGAGDARRLTPLVYIPGGDTVFWENSCASGSSAVGMYAAACEDGPVRLGLAEPGGILRVVSDPMQGETWLMGKVQIVEEHT